MLLGETFWRNNVDMINNDTYIKYEMLGGQKKNSRAKMTVFTFLSLHLHRIASRHISIPILGLPKVERLPKKCFSCTKSKNLSIFHHFFLRCCFLLAMILQIFRSWNLKNSTFLAKKLEKLQTRRQFNVLTPFSPKNLEISMIKWFSCTEILLF